MLYVSGTQDQADKHIGTIASMLGSKELAQQDPDLSDRRVDKFGNRILRMRGHRRADRLPWRRKTCADYWLRMLKR